MPEQRDKSVAELVFDVSERTSTLIREEVELAKAEITEKVTKLLRGSAVGAAAGVFAFLALILVMEGFAWLLNEEVFDNSWAGFFVEAAIFLLVAAGAGWFAYTSVKAGSPPVPEQAIEEAKLIRETIEGDEPAPAPATPAAGARHAPAIPGSGRMSAHPEPVRPSTTGLPGRTPAQIRADIDAQRRDLGNSVDELRTRVTELTDWRRQVREHRSQLIVGAAVVGFAVGGLMMLRRRG